MKKILLFLPAVLLGINSQAQDVHFSQVYNNPLYVNPANVGGFTGYERVVLNYRSQWASSGSPYTTMGFSFDMPMFQKDGEKAHIGLGLSVYNDRAGDSKFGTTAPALTFGGIVPMGKYSKFTTAIQLGYLQRSVNLSGVQWGSQFDGKEYNPILPTLENQSSVSDGAFDIGAGIRYAIDQKNETFGGFTFNKFDIGASMYHITQPKMNFLVGGDKVYYRLVAHTSARFDLKEANFGFLPYFVMFLQGPYSQYNGGLLVRYKFSGGTKITGFFTESALYVGAHYRSNDAFIPQVMFEYGAWGIGVSYDLTVSTYKQANNLNGGFEVSVKWHDLKGAVFHKRTNSKIY